MYLKYINMFPLLELFIKSNWDISFICAFCLKRQLKMLITVVFPYFSGNTQSTTEDFTAAIVSSSGCGTSFPVTSMLKRGLCFSKYVVLCLSQQKAFNFLYKMVLTIVFCSFSCIFTVCHQLFEATSSRFCLPQTTFLHPLCGSFR